MYYVEEQKVSFSLCFLIADCGFDCFIVFHDPFVWS
mgnify:CR=1 FL=1